MDRCIGEILGIALGALLQAACQAGFSDCFDCCCDKQKESEEATETLITKEPSSGESLISQKVYNTTGIEFSSKMNTGFSRGYN